MDLFSFPYSDDNKKNIVNNGGNNGNELKNVTCKRIFPMPPFVNPPSPINW